MVYVNYENMKQFCDRFNGITETVEMSIEDKQFMQFWKTELAIALLKDIGTDLGKEIANTMMFLCSQC